MKLLRSDGRNCFDSVGCTCSLIYVLGDGLCESIPKDPPPPYWLLYTHLLRHQQPKIICTSHQHWPQAPPPVRTEKDHRCLVPVFKNIWIDYLCLYRRSNRIEFDGHLKSIRSAFDLFEVHSIRLDSWRRKKRKAGGETVGHTHCLFSHRGKKGQRWCKEKEFKG